MNIVEPVLFQCKLSPLATAICIPGSAGRAVKYGQLGNFIHNVASNALKTGIARGNVAAILVSDTVLHASLILGLASVGVTTLSLRGAHAVSGVSPDVILTDVPGQFSEPATLLNVDQSWLEGDGTPPQDASFMQTSEDDICRITLTSGTTGLPKGIASSHKMLAGRIPHFTHSRGARFAHCSRFFCDLSIGTSPGFTYTMALLSRGGTIYFLGPDPADILQFFDLHKIQGMATSPYGLGEFLKYFEADEAFEVSLDHIICQGAMLSSELSRRARARLCQNLYCSYGATESGGMAFGPASVLETVPGSVGYPQPGVIVEIADRSGNPLPAMRDGRVRIRSDYMATEYIGDPEASRAFFRDGYFYSGDVGHFTADGLLVITGREKTALNVGGDTVAPESVEALISSFENVAEAGVFAADNSLGVAELSAVIVTRAPVDEAALRDYCARRLPPSCVPVRFIMVDALPRGGQGKIERHRLAELAMAARPAAR